MEYFSIVVFYFTGTSSTTDSSSTHIKGYVDLPTSVSAHKTEYLHTADL